MTANKMPPNPTPSYQSDQPARANKMPEMPEAAGWSSGLDWHPNPRYESEMVVKLTRNEQAEHGFTLGLYTADQMRAMYLAGIADAKACVGEAVTYTDLKGPEPRIPEHNAYNRGVTDGMNGRRETILTNLTALEQEAKK